jgi:hypothetical protein
MRVSLKSIGTQNIDLQVVFCRIISTILSYIQRQDVTQKTCRFKILPFGQVMNVVEATIKTSRGGLLTVKFNTCWKNLKKTLRACLRFWRLVDEIDFIKSKNPKEWSDSCWLLDLAFLIYVKKQSFKSEGRRQKRGSYDKYFKINQNKTSLWMSHIRDEVSRTRPKLEENRTSDEPFG